MRAIWKHWRASFPFNLRGERKEKGGGGGDVRWRNRHGGAALSSSSAHLPPVHIHQRGHESWENGWKLKETAKERKIIKGERNDRGDLNRERHNQRTTAGMFTLFSFFLSLYPNLTLCNTHKSLLYSLLIHLLFPFTFVFPPMFSLYN